MIVPPRATANSSASADLPLAVGPATRMTGDKADFLRSSRVRRCARNDSKKTPSLREAQRRRNLGTRLGRRGGSSVNLVMTLIAGPGGARTLPDLVATLAAALPLVGEPDWLAPGAACDLRLTGIARDAAEAAARRAIGDAAIDVVVQPMAGRKKRVLVAELEATIIENEM